MTPDNNLSFRLLQAREFEPLRMDPLGEAERECLMNTAENVVDPAIEKDLLGLHLEKTSPHAWWFVGQVWLRLGATRSEQVVFRVEPKVEARPYQMYVECLSNPSVRAHLDNCISIFWREPPIPINRTLHPITPLIALRYLGLLYDLCQRNIRLTISSREENLVNRIKGRPLINAILRGNQPKGRLDRVWCRFSLQSVDSTPNQILAAALHKAAKYLHGNQVLRDDQGISRLVTFSLSALSGVTLRRIFASDFQGLNYGGFLRPYREPHRWASLVLRLLGSDPLEDIKLSGTAIDLPPFAINMNELFERFCEAGLRKLPNQQVWAGYSERARNLGVQFRVRPDFLVRDGKTGWIVDSKYKGSWNWREHREDVNQVIAYSRHRMVLEKLALGPEDAQGLVVLYPGAPEEKPVDSKHGIGLFETSCAETAPDDRVLRDFQVPVVRTPIKLPS